MHARRPTAPLDPRRWIVLAILSGSLLLISMDTTILNVAFPSLVGDLRPGAVQQLWIIDVYALALSGLLVTAGAVLVVHPEWRATVAVVLAAAGAVLLAATLVPGNPSVRRGRLGDVAEVVSLVALVPLLVLAVGLFDQVRG